MCISFSRETEDIARFRGLPARRYRNTEREPNLPFDPNTRLRDTLIFYLRYEENTKRR